MEILHTQPSVATWAAERWRPTASEGQIKGGGHSGSCSPIVQHFRAGGHLKQVDFVCLSCVVGQNAVVTEPVRQVDMSSLRTGEPQS